MMNDPIQTVVLLDGNQREHVAGLLRHMASYGLSRLSAATVEQACEVADQLYPLSGGPWRPIPPVAPTRKPDLLN